MRVAECLPSKKLHCVIFFCCGGSVLVLMYYETKEESLPRVEHWLCVGNRLLVKFNCYGLFEDESLI